MLANVGVGSVVSVTIFWMFALWFGWSLLYLSSGRAVLDANTMEPSDGWSRIYFAGYSLYTSGLGDRVPGSASWQIATVLTSLTGLGLVTLAITFLVPVLQAATDRRSLARTIDHLGGTTGEIVDRSWTDNARLASLADQMATEFSALTEKHLSYPVLDHFHSASPITAFAPRVAALHDAMLIARFDARDDQRPSLDLALITIDGFANVADARRATDIPGQPPPLPASCPIGSEQRFEDAAGTRRQLEALAEHDGWS